jgi:ribose transport system substrate-binding protein
MRRNGSAITAIAALGLAAMIAPVAAQQGLDEPFQKPFKESLAGKTVAYVPVAMNFDSSRTALSSKSVTRTGTRIPARRP